MLKIKDDVDLKVIRKKYGFIVEDGFYMEPSIDKERIVRINCHDNYYSREINEKLDDLYDLIQVGYVEKVKEYKV